VADGFGSAKQHIRIERQTRAHARAFCLSESGGWRDNTYTGKGGTKRE